MKLHIIQIEATADELRVSRGLSDAFSDMIAHLCDVVTRTYAPEPVVEYDEDEEEEDEQQ